MGNDNRPGPRTPWPVIPRNYTQRLRLMLPSSKASINEAVEQILNTAACCGDLEDSRTDLEIALREALANAVIHGNGDSKGKRIFVRCYAGPRSGVLVIVRDEGKGFNPQDVPDPRSDERLHLDHGRGVFLMKRLMDVVEFRRGGSEVLLYKSI